MIAIRASEEKHIEDLAQDRGLWKTFWWSSAVCPTDDKDDDDHNVDDGEGGDADGGALLGSIDSV